MKRGGKSESKIETGDGWNRTFYGSPTVGGFVVVGIIAAFIIYNIFFK
ncbi:hypothetical protein [Bacillus sp. B-jedd]|nr:hypothetical protein [Bacillus sp. B-jedd]